MKDVLFKKKIITTVLDYGGRHYFICTVHSGSMASYGCTSQ